jgi:hypothetical protein
VSVGLLSACTESKTDEGSDTGGTSQVAEEGDAHLIGLGFSSEGGTHELRSIDPGTAEVSLVGTVDFGADGYESWFGVMTDSDAGVLYAVSTAGDLHSVAMDGSAATNVGTLSQSIQAMDVGNDGLVGIGYDEGRGLNVLRSIDVTTAEVTDLTTFEFDSGSWQAYVVNDPAAGVLYAVSMNDTLYRLQMDGSAVEAIGTLTQGIQHMGVGIGGLIGVGYNEQSGLNELRSIVLYARSTGNTLYRLQMDGSGVETIGALSDGILPYAMGLGEY